MTEQNHSIINESIVKDNETAAQAAFNRRDYVTCFLLSHSLIEALLRAFLTKTKRERFDDLITEYKKYLQQEGQTHPTFVDELTKFNRQRNRVIHDLWKKGYTETNKKLESACRAAFIIYGLFIEWLETFQPDITEFGFDYDTPIQKT